MDEPELDCLIVGGGPAALTAAIYLARFHLSIRVIDAGNSRASWIPCTRKHAGFPEGISGAERIERMKAQACKYGASVETERVTRLQRADGGFRAAWGSGEATARRGVVAAATRKPQPPMDEALHDEALARGLIRYCPICDGYEVTDKKIGVIGSDSHGVAEALFLRSYTADITLIAPDKALHLKVDDLQRLKAARIDAVDGPCS